MNTRFAAVLMAKPSTGIFAPSSPAAAASGQLPITIAGPSTILPFETGSSTPVASRRHSCNSAIAASRSRPPGTAMMHIVAWGVPFSASGTAACVGAGLTVTLVRSAGAAAATPAIV